MHDIRNRPQGVDVVRYSENRAKFPPEQLLKYAGQHIAWNAEGTQVVASAPNDEALLEQLESRGIDPGRVVFDYVDPIYDEIDEHVWDSIDSRPAGVPAAPPQLSSRSARCPEPPDVSQYPENRATYPPEELLRYAGQYLAWSPDGLQILASGSDEESIEQQLVARGIDPGQVVLEYIDALY